MTVTVKVLISGKTAEATHKEQLLVLKKLVDGEI